MRNILAFFSHAMIAKIAAVFFSVPLFFVASLIPEHRVEAATIDWTLNNGSWSGGGTISGSFDWNTTTETVTSYSFTVSGGDTTTFPATTYSTPSSGFIFAPSTNTVLNFCLVAADCGVSGTRLLRFSFSAGALNTPTASLSLVSDFLTGSTGYVECFDCNPFRQGGAGATFSATVVPSTPLPATLPLFATGIGALGLLGWRKKRKAQAVA